MRNPQYPDPRDYAFLFLLVILVAFAFQGSRGLYESTEGRYAEVAREMVETGNWWTPQLEYRPHWSKPPMTYWAIAGGIRLLGRNEWGVRLYGAIALVLATAAVVRLGAILGGPETGYLSGLIFGVSPFTFLGTNAVSTDMLLSLWELLAVLSYWTAVRRRGRGESGRRHIAGMWAFLGLAFLTKGYPALLCLLVILVFHGWERRWGRDLPRLAEPVGLFLFVLIGFSWFIAVILKDPSLLGYYWRDEFVARVASERFHRNPEWYKPFVIYLPALALGLGPWLACAWKSPGRFVPSGRPASGRAKGPGSLASARRFLWIWISIPLVILFFSSSRLVLYLLPFFAPAAILTAMRLRRSHGPMRERRTPATIAAVMALLLIAVKGIAPRLPIPNDMRPLYRAVAPSGEPAGPVYLVDEGKHYGLWFYLDGQIERVNSGRSPEEGGRDLRSLLQRILTMPGAPAARFIVKEKNETARQILEAGGDARISRSRVDGYLVYTAR